MVLQGSCNSSAAGVADSTYIQQLLLERKEKDNSFAAGANSPFAELKEDFTGLKYFDPNKDWNVSGDVIIPDTTYTFEIVDSKGGKRYYIYSGTFRFQKGGKKYGVPLFRE
ncbi:MAG: hypothetical protein IT244_05750, partial [Bacteroidia bacterium]|nr:hypothetical protein [Bacteroidia bacterium]